MAYLNPFELLHAFADESGEQVAFDEKSLRRARRRAVAVTDLEGTFKFKNKQLSKNEVIEILEELDDEDLYENHEVIFKTGYLLDFLSDGDPAIFEIEDEYEIYDYCVEFDLIAKPFAEQFNKLFAEAFYRNYALLIEKMSRFLIFVDDEYFDTCFKDVERIFVKQLDEYETLISDIKKENFDPDDTKTLLSKIRADVNVEALNALPEYFDLRRDELASLIDQIAVNLYLKYKETETALALSKIAESITAETLTHKRIKHNKEVFEEELSQTEFAKHLKKIERVAAITDQLKQVTKDLRERFLPGSKENKLGNRIFISGLKNRIRDILDFNEINGLSDESYISGNMRDSIALQLKELSDISYNQGNSLDLALSLLEMALEIRVTPLTYSLLQKSKNYLISKMQSVNYPSVGDKFYIENNVSDPVSPKPGFGQNNHSGNKKKQGNRGGSKYGRTKIYNNKKYETVPLFNYSSGGNQMELKQIFLKISISFLLVLVPVVIYIRCSPGDKFNEINAELKKMNSGTGFSVPAKISDKLNQIKLKKKLLPVSAETRAVDTDFYNQMPFDMKPVLFSEVNTFVWIHRYEDQEIVSYNPKQIRTKIKTDLVMVDKAQNAVILRKTFDENPTSLTNNRQAEKGEITDSRIISYLIEISEK